VDQFAEALVVNKGKDGTNPWGAVHVSQEESPLEDAIGSHACSLACSLEASMHVTTHLPFERPLHLTVPIVNYVTTLKVQDGITTGSQLH
jgi:hypothetical protein